VCGVTILYNPQQEVINNINSYLEQVDYLLLIDNSDVPSYFINEYFKNIEKVKYVFNNSNLGIAKALNIGAEKALELGSKYILTMDQDSKAPSNLVEELIKAIIKKEKVGIVSPLQSNKYDTHKKFSNSIDVPRVMTSGNLLSLNVFKVVGDFCEDYFIDYVDIEYCMRLKKNNFEVIGLNDVILEHNEANIVEKQLFSKRYYPTNNLPFRWYYKTRNLLYLRKKYKNIFPSACKEEVDTFVRNFVKVILFEGNKISKVKMMMIGLLDYAKGMEGRKF
jgi:rhamnosyltransferase